MRVRKLSSQAKNYVKGLQGKISKSNTGLVVPVSTTQSGNLLIHGHQIEYPESFASVMKKKLALEYTYSWSLLMRVIIMISVNQAVFK